MYLALSHHEKPVDPLPSRTSTVLTAVGAEEAVASLRVCLECSTDGSVLRIDIRDAMIAAL